MIDKKTALTNLLGHALNELVANKKVDLNSISDESSGFLECVILKKPSIINYSYIGHGEIRMSIWWDFDKTKHPQHIEGGFKNKKNINIGGNSIENYRTNAPLCKKGKYKDFVGVVVGCFIERKTGKHLQISNDRVGLYDAYVRRSALPQLLSIDKCDPNGFELSGKFFL